MCICLALVPLPVLAPVVGNYILIAVRLVVSHHAKSDLSLGRVIFPAGGRRAVMIAGPCGFCDGIEFRQGFGGHGDDWRRFFRLPALAGFLLIHRAARGLDDNAGCFALVDIPGFGKERDQVAPIIRCMVVILAVLPDVETAYRVVRAQGGERPVFCILPVSAGGKKEGFDDGPADTATRLLKYIHAQIKFPSRLNKARAGSRTLPKTITRSRALPGPAAPCLAAPCLTSPRPACVAASCHAALRHARPDLATPAASNPVMLSLTSSCNACRAKSCRACHADPCQTMPLQVMPRPAASNRSSPCLPCLSPLGHIPPHLACHALPNPIVTSRASSKRVLPAASYFHCSRFLLSSDCVDVLENPPELFQLFIFLFEPFEFLKRVHQ